MRLAAAAVILAWMSTALALPRGWIEGGYANGLFADLNRALVPAADRVPFALSDVELLAVLAFFAAWTIRARRRRVRWWRIGARAVACAALGVALFEVLWGWNYRRIPVAERVAYDESRVTAASVADFSRRVVGILNRDVAAAHAETLDRARLEAAFAPIAARLGDRWTVAVTAPKTTIFQRYYDAAGIGGQYSPFSFETLLNASFLPFETPRALAHEWAHVAGFTGEGDANYVATLACLRSEDALIRYSGAFWTYGDLPEAERRKLRLDPRVVADFRAASERFRRGYVPQIFAVQWRFYDRYLRANNVAGGVASYGGFLKLLVGAPLDEAGLPVLRNAPPR